MNSSQPLDGWLGRSLGDVVSAGRSETRQRYRIEQRLGGGGMGDVFLATDTLLDQPVALKVLSDRLSTGELRRRFEQEVAVCAALRSAHIVQVSDYGVSPDGYPFYVMEYLEGQTLGQLLEQSGRLSTERAIGIMAQLCVGLRLAHEGVSLRQSNGSISEKVKVVHRDLKPDNIFLVPTALGELVKILDFGIAKLRTNDAGRTNATTAFLGTYRYAAPEQFDVQQDLDERADIYSLGLLLYEMLSGTDPFGFRHAGDHHVMGVAWGVAHLSKPSIPLREQPDCEHLSPVLEAVVMQCLQKAPEQRFNSVGALSQALYAAVPELGDRGWLLAQSPAPTTGVTNLPPPVPTLIHPRFSAAATGDFVTQNVGRSIAGTASKDRDRSPRSRWLRQPAVLFTSATVAIALGLGGYFAVQSLPPSITTEQSALPVATPSPSVSATPAETTARRSLTGHSDTVWAVAIDPVQQTVVSGSADKTMRLWDRQTGKLLRTLSGHTDVVRAIAISTDGKLLASGSGDKTIKLWSLPTGTLLRTLSGHSGPVWSVAMSADGQTLASGSYDGTIKIWALQTGELLRTLPDHYDSVWAVALSPDGKTLASGSYDGTIKIWDLQAGQVLHSLSNHTDTVRSVAISPDGKTLVSGSWDKTLKVWNLQTGTLLRTLSGHSDRVLAVAISPDGKTIASSSVDRTVRLWERQTGNPLRTLAGHTDWVTAVAFGADSTMLVSGSKDKTIHLWQW